MTKKEKTVVIQELWEDSGGRFEIKHEKYSEVFEFDDSGERVDQLRNACLFAQRLIDGGEYSHAAFQPENGEIGVPVKNVFYAGKLMLNINPQQGKSPSLCETTIMQP